MQSENEHGTFSAKIAQDQGRFVGETSSPAAEGMLQMHMGHGEMVLLMEDEAAILKVGKAMLEKLGYAVVTAGTPTEALSQAEIHYAEMRLLITDVIMPGMNGRDLEKKSMKPTRG